MQITIQTPTKSRSSLFLDHLLYDCQRAVGVPSLDRIQKATKGMQCDPPTSSFQKPGLLITSKGGCEARIKIDEHLVSGGRHYAAMQLGVVCFAIGEIGIHSMWLGKNSSDFLDLRGRRSSRRQASCLFADCAEHLPLVAEAVVPKVFLERCGWTAHIGPRTLSFLELSLGYEHPRCFSDCSSAHHQRVGENRLIGKTRPYRAVSPCSTNGSYKMAWRAEAAAV